MRMASLPEIVAQADLDAVIVDALLDVEGAVVVGDVFGARHREIFIAEVERNILTDLIGEAGAHRIGKVELGL